MWQKDQIFLVKWMQNGSEIATRAEIQIESHPHSNFYSLWTQNYIIFISF